MRSRLKFIGEYLYYSNFYFFFSTIDYIKIDGIIITLRSLTTFGEISRHIIVRVHRSAVPCETVSLPVVIVGFEPRIDHAVGGETSALLRHPLRQRGRRVSALVPSPAMSVPLASPLLPGKTIGLRFWSRALCRETLVLCREGRVHRMHPIVEMWI